jgi:hypothetical protein
MSRQLSLKALFPNGTMTIVFLRGKKYKLVWSNWAAVPEIEKEALWELIKEHYVFPFDFEELDKRATILTISRALHMFRHALNKFYVHPGVSPLNRFGFITPNEWNTFQQLYTTLEAIALNNRMKELNQKNKFKHKLGYGGYKAAIPLSTKKNRRFLRLGYRIPLKVEHCA